MAITLAQLLCAARTSPYILTIESAAYLVLCLTECCVAAPRRLSLHSAQLEPGGGITLLEEELCGPLEADRSLRELLDVLMHAASATPSDALRVIACGAPVSPTHLLRELVAALIPLNRAAARRALARLHRRVGALGPLLEPDSSSPLGIPSVEIEERLPCSGDVQRLAAAPSEEIEVQVDEPEWEHAVWQPSHDTPWQFNPRGPARDGTPLLGSLEVRLRNPETQRDEEPSPSETLRVEGQNYHSTGAGWTQCPADSVTLADAPVALRTQGRAPELSALPLPLKRLSAQPQGYVATAPEVSPELSPTSGPVGDMATTSAEPDTIVDAQVRCEPYFGEFNSRRSEVATLVEQFAHSNRPAEDVREALLRLADAECLNPGTATPPPVAQELRRQVHAPPRRPPMRRILLSSLAAVGTTVGLGSLWTNDASAPHGPPLTAAPSEFRGCLATIQVEVPEGALVYLNDDQDRAEQKGPMAVFPQVSCTSQPEVTVRVPSDSMTGSGHSWVRLPLPEQDLRAASEHGRTLTISPLRD